MFAGQVCGDIQCLVDYTDIAIAADHHKIRDCIQTDNDSPVPMPELLMESDKPEGQYTARFQLGSGVFYDELDCTDRKTGIKVTCVDGTIELIESNSDKECVVTGENEIECTENADSILNEHVDVAIFECTTIGEGPPHVHAEYYATDIEVRSAFLLKTAGSGVAFLPTVNLQHWKTHENNTGGGMPFVYGTNVWQMYSLLFFKLQPCMRKCDSSSVEFGQRFLNLGVLCGDLGDQRYYSEDFFFECARDNAFFTTTDDMRFTCGSEVLIPSGSAGVPYQIPTVEIETDYRW